LLTLIHVKDLFSGTDTDDEPSSVMTSSVTDMEETDGMPTTETATSDFPNRPRVRNTSTNVHLFSLFWKCPFKMSHA